MTYHLAQINIGRLVAPIDNPKNRSLWRAGPINALADRAPGFVWRLQSASGNATDIVYSDDPFMIVSMSVWESIEALRDFTYRSDHIGFFRDRAEWFITMDKPSIACGGSLRGIGRPSPRDGNGWNGISCTERRRFPLVFETVSATGG